MFFRPPLSLPEGEGERDFSSYDIFIDNFSIAVQDLDPLTTLKEYTSDLLDIIAQMDSMKGTYVHILSSREAQISRAEAHEVVYTLTQYEYSPEIIQMGVPEEVHTEGASFQILQTWVIHRQRAYIFTYIATSDTYQRFLDDVQDMIRSVQLS